MSLPQVTKETGYAVCRELEREENNGFVIRTRCRGISSSRASASESRDPIMNSPAGIRTSFVPIEFVTILAFAGRFDPLGQGLLLTSWDVTGVCVRLSLGVSRAQLAARPVQQPNNKHVRLVIAALLSGRSSARHFI